MAEQPTARFTAWLDTHRVLVLVTSLVLAVAGGVLASRMRVQASLTDLLPPDEPSVRGLRAVQARARPFGTVNILIESDDVALRARAGAALRRELATLPAELVAQLVADDGDLARFAWTYRFQLAPLDDLVAARDALRARIDQAKLDANPLFVQLDDPDESAPPDRLDELEQQLSRLEQRAKAPELRVSKDGRFQLFTVQTTFAGSDANKANQLIAAVKGAIARTEREVGRGVRYGLTGNITTAMYEHDSVLDGMALAAGITVVLCALALVFYYGSGRAVLAILWALGVGVAATFAAAWAAIGHLNVMTAFLFAIVIGNGINAGMILAARYLEELRAGGEPRAAMHQAMVGTVRGTTAAMATAAAAYTSLFVSNFRGFQQFGAIAGVGMVLTWVTAYTVLPALLLALTRWRLIAPRREAPGLSTALARLVPEPRGYRGVLVGAVAVTALAAVIAVRYIANDPFTEDWRDLQSSTPAINGARALDQRINAAFDNRSMLSGQAYQVVIALERRDQVTPLVARLRAENDARPASRRWIHDVRSMDDIVPADQPARLAVLREIDELLGSPELQATLDEAASARLARLRPPPDVVPIRDADVPVSLGWPFIERDGTRGRLVIVRGSGRFNSFDVKDRLEFAREARAMTLPEGALVAGEALVVADIIETMERDAPNIIAFALAGSLLTVLVLLGLRRHGVVTILCGLAGVVLMIAACAIAGIRVHFLDLIALPITIGIGIDYAVNLTARDRQDGHRGARHLLRTTGATVLLCSYTTTVGYGTLLLSANGGIRAFGLAALIGEVACITMALVVAPVWLAVLRQRASREVPDNARS